MSEKGSSIWNRYETFEVCTYTGNLLCIYPLQNGPFTLLGKVKVLLFFNAVEDHFTTVLPILHTM